MAIYKLDYVNDEIAASIEVEASFGGGYLYGLPNGDAVHLTDDFIKYQSDIYIDKYLEKMAAAESDSANKN